MFWLMFIVLLDICHSDGKLNNGLEVNKHWLEWLNEGKHFLTQNDENKDSANTANSKRNIQEIPPLTSVSSSDDTNYDADVSNEDPDSGITIREDPDPDVPTPDDSDPGIAIQEDLDLGVPTPDDSDPGIAIREDPDPGVPTPEGADSTEATHPMNFYYNKRYIFNLFMVASSKPELISSEGNEGIRKAKDTFIEGKISNILNKFFENRRKSYRNSKSDQTTASIDRRLLIDINIDKENPNIVTNRSKSSPGTINTIIDKIFKRAGLGEKKVHKKAPEKGKPPIDDFVRSWFEKRLFSSESNRAIELNLSTTPPKAPKFSLTTKISESNEEYNTIYDQVRKVAARVLPSMFAKAVEEHLNQPQMKDNKK